MLAAIWTQLDSLLYSISKQTEEKPVSIHVHTYCTRTACRECSGTVLKLLYLKIISPEGLQYQLRTHSNNLGNNTA